MPPKRSAREARLEHVDSTVPVSAFAAARSQAANKRPLRHATTNLHSDIDDGTAISLTVDSRDPASLLAGVIDRVAPTSAGIDSFNECDSDSDVVSSSQLAPTDTTSKTASPIARQFSTVPIDALTRVRLATRVTLRGFDKLVAVGCYGLEVIEGAVTVCGALLRSGQPLRTVWAPASHALPCIVAKTDAIVQIHHLENHLAPFESLSPLWSRLWTAQSDVKTSFTIVRIPAI